MLNRSAISIKPKQPMIDWINSQDDQTMTLEAITGDLTILLIPEVEMEADFEKAIKLNWSNLFEDSLAEWYTDESMWPKKRNYEMFIEWFEILKFSVVEDLVGDELVSD